MTTAQGWMPAWSGEAVNWECDELGHLNMRHYVAKAAEARRYLFISLGLTQAFTRGAMSTVTPSVVTTCYLREARPGARLSIRSGVTRLGGTDADVVHVMEHSDGSRAATLQETVSHISRRTGEAFRWPSRLRDAVELIDVCDVGPRGLDADEVASAPDLDAVAALGTTRVGAGVFREDEAGVFGTVLPYALQGRLSESVGNFRDGWPEAYGHDGIWSPGPRGPKTQDDAKLSGILLEMRMFLHRAARPGEAFEIRSGVARAEGTTRRLVHHMHDPVSGRSLASFSATSAIFDLQRRKLVKPDAETLAQLERVRIEGLRA